MSPSGRQARAVQLERLRSQLAVDVTEDLLDLALTHRSYAYEHGGIPDNERLEFLGDSVLGILVTDELYRRFPDHDEGQLAKIRASMHGRWLRSRAAWILAPTCYWGGARSAPAVTTSPRSSPTALKQSSARST